MGFVAGSDEVQRPVTRSGEGRVGEQGGEDGVEECDGAKLPPHGQGGDFVERKHVGRELPLRAPVAGVRRRRIHGGGGNRDTR